MASVMRYRVVRPHEGDRVYQEGEFRDADPEIVAHLVPKVLVLAGPVPKAKAEPAPKNKAEVAPANKAARQRKSKSGK